MMSIKFSSLFFFLLISSGTHALNDWSKPCLNGVCSYDLPDTPNGPSGTLKIWGADTDIADITPAAGWEILGCSPNATEQDVRIVCRGGNETSGCQHLFSTPSGSAPSSASIIQVRAATAAVASSVVVAPETSGTALPSSGDGEEQGAVGKVVRLPQNCGKQPFARISKAWIPTDQSIPSSISKRLVRRAGETSPTVKAVRIDTKFGDGDVKTRGPVGFAVVGANVPGAAVKGDLDTSMIQIGNSTTAAARRSSRIYIASEGKRGLGDFVSGAIDTVAGLRDFDVNKTKTLTPLDVDKTVNLIDQSIDCSKDVGKGDVSVGVNGKLKIDVDAKAHAVVTVGVAASGTLLPPKIEDFGITSSMTADINGAIVMSAGVGGSLDSGDIPIFEVGVPGLDFPGVLTIGPSFQVNANAKATLELDVDMTVGVSYHVDNAQFVFPKGGKKSGTFNPGDTPLKLSAQPSGKATGTVEAHLIPSLNLGVSAIGGIVEAKVFVNLDASASMTLSVDATAGEKDVNLGRRALPGAIDEEAMRGVMIPRGRGLIGSHYFTKRSPSPSPFGFGDIVDGVKGAASAVGDKVSSAASKVKDGVTAAAKKVGDGVSSAAKVVGDGVKKVAGEAKDGAEAVGSGVKKVAGKVEDGVKKVTGGDAKPTTKAVAEKTTTTKAPKKTTTTKAAKSTSAKTGSTSAAAPTETNKVDAVVPPTSPDASFGGCLEMDAGFDVNVGADADFFGLFDPSTSLSLFSKKFTLFKKCFGDAQAQRRGVDLSKRWTGLEGRALVCNNVNVSGVESLVDETVPAAKIK